MGHPDTLHVYPNPYAAPLDTKGRPSAAYPWDPHHNPNRGWVGARLQAEGDDVAFVFDEGVVVLPYLVHSNHYRRGVQHGALVAADEETARRCGVPFRAPSEVLAEARTDAIARWTAERPDEMPAIARPAQPAPTEPAAAPPGHPSEAAGGEHAVGDTPANGAS